MSKTVTGSQPIRVLLAAPSFGDVGGIEGFLIRLARMIDSADDLEVTLCLKRVRPFALQDSLAQALDRETFPVIFVDRASRDLVKAIRGADVVHSQTPSIEIATIAAVLRKPHVMTFHSSRDHAPRLRQWIAARLPDRKLYGSNYSWSTWEPRGRRRTSDRLPIIADLPTGSVDPDKRRGFVFAGRWIPGKGLDTLVDAYARARIDRSAWPLVILGDGPLRPNVEQEVLRREIDTVQMPGHVSIEKRDAAIRNAKWMVIPSNVKETYPLTAGEARHAGIPCIVTRDGGLPEAAGSLSLSCEPGDAAQLALLMEFAAEMDAHTYNWLAEATRREFLAGMRPLEVYLDLYREMAARRRFARSR